MDIVEQMRSFESDHEPDGWPAIQMKQVGALCDEVERLRAEIDAANAQEPFRWFLADKVNQSEDMLSEVTGNIDPAREVLMPMYLRPIPAQQSPAVAVPDDWPTAKMIVRGCEQFYDSMKSFGFSLGNDTESAKMQESVVEAVFDAMLGADELRQSPRITEQDAGEILLSYGVEYIGILQWLKGKGRSTIAKLNEVKHD